MGRVRDPKSEANAHLQKVAAAGRARRRRESDEAAASEAAEVSAKAAAGDGRVRAILLGRGPYEYIGLGLAVGLPLLAMAVSPRHFGVEEGQFYLAIAMVPGVLAFLAVRWLVGRGIVAREPARLAALGFAVDGWFEVMRDRSLDNGRQRIELQFRGKAPPATHVQALMSRVAAEPDDDPGRYKSPFLVARKTPLVPPNARAFVKFQSQLLDEVLVPLHAEFPLSRVILHAPVGGERAGQ